MIVHVLSVKGRTATCDNLNLVQGSRGVDRIVLDLDAEWQNAAIELSFVYDGGAVRAVPKNEDETYTVPWECMANAGSVRAVVEGRGRSGEVMKHARMETAFYVQPADFADDAPAPGEPTAGEWREIAEQAKAATKTANDAAADIARRAEAGEFDGPQGPAGPQGPKGADGVRPLSGDGVDVDESGRCSADIAGACAAVCFAGVKVAQMADGVTGSAKAVVLPYGLLVTALELNCTKKVQAAGSVQLLSFAAGFKPKAAYSVPLCELPSSTGNYYGASARFDTDGTVSLSIYMSTAGSVALSIGRGAVPQLFVPFTGGGNSTSLTLAASAS